MFWLKSKKGYFQGCWGQWGTKPLVMVTSEPFGYADHPSHREVGINNYATVFPTQAAALHVIQGIEATWGRGSDWEIVPAQAGCAVPNPTV
jgi:hypothetical protein